MKRTYYANPNQASPEHYLTTTRKVPNLPYLSYSTQ